MHSGSVSHVATLLRNRKKEELGAEAPRVLDARHGVVISRNSRGLPVIIRLASGLALPGPALVRRAVGVVRVRLLRPLLRSSGARDRDLQKVANSPSIVASAETTRVLACSG